MGKRFDVVVVGELNVDLILNQIERVPEVGKEVIADEMTLTIGSSSGIFSCNLSTLGSAVAFVGKLGNDNFGEFVLRSLKSKGVNVDLITLSPNSLTGLTSILNFGEDRAMVTHPGAMKDLRITDISDDILQQGRHLHLSSVFLQTGLINDITELFRRAKSFGMTTSLDPQWDPSEKWNIDLVTLLPHVDVFMPNEKELSLLAREADFNTAARSMAEISNILVVKNGSEGAYLFNDGEMLFQPAFRNIKVADSIGAGDSFNAGFIHKFILQKSLAECLEFGALMGAVNTTRAGGTTAFESTDMIKAIAKSHFNHCYS
jgi:sugar/nucleoside kinase (ribokinase family)